MCSMLSFNCYHQNHIKRGGILKKYIYMIKLEVIIQVFFSLIESLALAGLAYSPKYVIDSITGNGTMNVILLTITVYCGLSFISVLACYYAMKYNWKYAIKFENTIKKDYFDTVIKLDNMSFYKRNVADYISIQSNDIMQIEQDFLTPLVSAINQIIKVIVFGIVMFFGIDYRIGIIVFTSSVVAAFLPKFTGKKTAIKRLDFVNLLGQYTKTIHEFFNGFKEINTRTTPKIIEQHSNKIDSTSKSRFEYGKSKSKSLTINRMARTVVQILSFMTMIVLLAKNEISIGTSAATLGFINSFISPLEETLYCFTTMKTVKDVKDKVFNIIKEKNNNDKEILKKFNESLRIENICVSNESFELKNINFEFKKNKHYALIGSNGSGKSTLLNSIMGYLHINSGNILLDNKIVSNHDLSWVISYLSQNSYIFSTDYENNVTMFNSYSDISENIMQEIGLDKQFIKKIKSQNNGTVLSGGEKQIISYLRARNANTPILIMDEPFSAVDIHTKQLLMEDIHRIKNKTIIMITHDIDTLTDNFEEIIEMDKGCIAKIVSS